MVRRILLVVSLVSASLLILAGLVYAQDSGPQAVDAPQAAVGTAFTYQGQLKSSDTGVTGSCEMAFRLYDAATVGNPVGVPLTQTVAVNEGFFTAQLDFGASVFNGQARWLEIAVKCASDAGFTTLSRQALTAAPYALYAPTAGTAANVTNGVYTTGAYADPAWLTSLAGSKISGAVATATTAGGVPWSGVTGIPAGFADGVDDVGSDWRLTGNSGTTPGTHWIGTNDSQALVFKVSGSQALRLEPDSTSPNIIGGRSNNTVASGVHGATISGGGSFNSPNLVTDTYGVVGGGYGNLSAGSAATVGGGNNNQATSANATVIGGGNNIASNFSFAAGSYAYAAHLGSFVWADGSSLITFTSSASNQFLIRATGGVGINTTDTLASGITVNGRVVAGGTATGAAGTEPFVSRGSTSGLSLDDRTGGADQRWVVYPTSGTLNFWTDSGTNGVRASLSDAGVLTINGLGSAGATTLCRNASNQIATCSSSIRYKDNISALDLGLATIAQLRPVTFDWTSNGEHDLGFVAEEVDQVTPLLTTRNAAGQIEGVKYDRVSAVLVKAVQEQQQQIDDLKHQNSELQTRLASLDQTASPTAFNVFNLLSVIAGGGFIYLLIQQRRSKHSLG